MKKNRLQKFSNKELLDELTNRLAEADKMKEALEKIEKGMECGGFGPFDEREAKVLEIARNALNIKNF